MVHFLIYTIGPSLFLHCLFQWCPGSLKLSHTLFEGEEDEEYLEKDDDETTIRVNEAGLQQNSYGTY